MAYFGITKGIIEGTIVYGDGHFKPYWGDIRIKKNGCLDTLHGYDFYEVEDRQYHNWLEAQERKLRGCMRRKNAREKEKEGALAAIEQRIENKSAWKMARGYEAGV
jgi:hypothetical protein